MKKSERESVGVPERAEDDDEPEGKPVTGILLGILALFLLVVVLQILQR
ncbi:MAG TPA: hypothetical protein VIG06_01945 [Kofleriaceae bacterium]|jgi:hypothetical protein